MVGNRKNSISDIEILASIQEVASKCGGDLSLYEYKQHRTSPSYTTIEKRFGTFSNACRQAGVKHISLPETMIAIPGLSSLA